MALTSPGVEVTIIDQSQYLPAPGSSVPLVVFATAQNKANPSGTGVAAGTTAANAGKLYQITSQKDLVDFYGVPFFYSTTAGTPIQGYELNEYGLLAAYSVLGVTNRCYTLRADIDLASLVGSVGRPSGAPADGTYWLDTTTSTWGIYEFNATTGAFTLQTPIVITDTDTYVSGGQPLDSIGNIGDYAIIADAQTGDQQYFYKNIVNEWNVLGSQTWAKNAWPAIQGTQSNPTLTATNTMVLNLSGNFDFTITVPGGGDNTVTGVKNVINALGYDGISAEVVSGKLQIFSGQPSDSTTPAYISVVSGTGTLLADLGITVGDYYQPATVYGTSSQMPLWTSSQTTPHPTGSVWIKVGSSGLGLKPVVSSYSTVTASFSAKNVTLATRPWYATTANDTTGGQLIPIGTLFGEYNFNSGLSGYTSPTYLYYRGAIGPTISTGTTTGITFNPNFSLASAIIYVEVSIPNSTTLTNAYEVVINDGDNATDFVTAWAAAGIPYTSATVTSTGAIQLSHTVGGEILMMDLVQTAGANKGKSAGLLTQAGFIQGTTPFCEATVIRVSSFSGIATTTTDGGSGLTVTLTTNSNGTYALTGSGVTAGGTAYAVGDTVIVNGSVLGGVSGTNNTQLIVTEVGGSGAVVALTIAEGFGDTAAGYNSTQLSNWVPLTYTVNEGAPVAAPANGTNWFWSVVDQVDILVQSGGQWNGYKNVNYDSNGFPTPTGTNATDPAGPIVAATAPTTQSDDTALVYGDLWIDTSDLEMYPIISRWQSVSGEDKWVLIDNANQTSSTGVVFADARWATNGNTNVVDDPIPSIVSLLSSDYLDLDAPSAALYPTGMLLFNTRRSGYNVKSYQTNYFNGISFPDESLPTETATWLSVSGLQANGAPYMGRQAQRNIVVIALRSAIDNNYDIRDEDNFFNLIATPAYPELQPNMVVLNNDRGSTGYILGDTPMRLPADATAIQAWATNAAGATSTGEAGCVTRDTYLGLFYPSGITSDLSGNLVAVPPSHMMLRTFIRNDTIAYPWLAAAGTRRGIIDNATSIGYIDSATGEFQVIKTRLGIRDVLYINFINPLVFFTGVGLLNYGNKTSYNSSSALDRTNVARLIAYIRRQLTLAARPFVFEPNDALTRTQIQGVIQTLLVDLVAKRGIYDYLVICDLSNNTPARIDRNELWVDVAIEPVKAAEFIYIPVRVLNTGEIAALG